MVVIAWMIDVLAAYEDARSIALFALLVIDLHMDLGSDSSNIPIDWQHLHKTQRQSCDVLTIRD